MNKKRKLLQKFLSESKNVSFDETVTLLKYLDFDLENKGRASGSRVQFTDGNVKIDLHKPHPNKYLKRYQIEIIKEKLREAGKL